jgi:hypothetical protein
MIASSLLSLHFWEAMTRIVSKSLALLQWVKDCPSDYVSIDLYAAGITGPLCHPSRPPRLWLQRAGSWEPGNLPAN